MFGPLRGCPVERALSAAFTSGVFSVGMFEAERSTLSLRRVISRSCQQKETIVLLRTVDGQLRQGNTRMLLNEISLSKYIIGLI